ncbi:MAG: alpha/beta fold hydrolase [Acidimicrobiales bacterium]
MKRVARRAGALIAAVVLVAACSSNRSSPSATTSAAQSGTTHATLRFGGITRTYRLYVPDASGPLALVVALHGGLGSGDQLADTTQFEALAAREHFVVAFPDGVGATWNAGTCCGVAVTRKIDDVAFLVALVEEIAHRVSIDRTRVSAVGHSNGAMMAFRLGCEAADVFSAIVPVAGSLEIDRCTPARAVSLLAIHGDADRNHPIDGGAGDRSISNVLYRSMSTSLVMWTAAMGCAQPSTTIAGPISTTAWTRCPPGVGTKYIVIAGADHPWPGSADRRATALQGVPTTALDATAVAWGFLEGG